MSKPQSAPCRPDIELACEAAWNLARLIGSLRLMVKPNKLRRPTSALCDKAGFVLGSLGEALAQHDPAITKVCDSIAKKKPVRFAGEHGTSLPDAILRRAYSIYEELETALRLAHLDAHFDSTPDQPSTTTETKPYNPSWHTAPSKAQPVPLEDLWVEGSWDAIAAIFAAVPKFDMKDVQAGLNCLLLARKPDKATKKGAPLKYPEMVNHAIELLKEGEDKASTIFRRCKQACPQEAKMAPKNSDSFMRTVQRQRAAR